MYNASVYNRYKINCFITLLLPLWLPSPGYGLFEVRNMGGPGCS